MALDETMARVEQDIERGDLGKARDRLEGLLAAYPGELQIRARLGEIYWRLQYPERAGRHWYLLPSENPDMDAAKQVFAARHNGDPARILRAIGYHGGLESIKGTYAGGVLQDLGKRARLADAALREAVRKRQPGEPPAPVSVPWRFKLVGLGLAALLIAILVLALIGLWSLMGI